MLMSQNLISENNTNSYNTQTVAISKMQAEEKKVLEANTKYLIERLEKIALRTEALTEKVATLSKNVDVVNAMLEAINDKD